MEEMQQKKSTLESRLFDIAMDWLSKVDHRDFYQQMVEFCANLLESDVCALYVRTEQINEEKRVCLVAGKLPPKHPKGLRMNPNEVGEKPKDHSYIVGKLAAENGEDTYDGITGRIATIGKAIVIESQKQANNTPGHASKWDKYVWQGDNKFRCMLGVPIIHEKEVIGVIKVENTIDGRPYDEDDKKLLIEISNSLVQPLMELINEGNELHPAIPEYEYRVPRSKPKIFEKKHSGEVLIKHSMTSICHSDIYYFLHQKSKSKLNDRLPLVIGHETTGEVYQVAGEYKYIDSEDYIQVKDHVVVIPLIPCETCSVCIGKYGKNYCPSSRFMASNHPGSLRTIYKYHSNLLLKINKPKNNEKYALFTEPMSNVVQMLQELCFIEEKNEFEVNVAPFSHQDFTYFHVPKDSFSNIFDTITAEEPNPRTLFILRDPNKKTTDRNYKINHQNIMIKGLGILGWPSEESLDFNEDKNTIRKIVEPKILILGSGVMAYLLATLLFNVYKIPKDMIVVTGRTPHKLSKFSNFAEGRVPVSTNNDQTYDFEKLSQNLISQGRPGKFDIVFECVGGPSIESNIHLGMLCLKDEGGIIAMEGLSDHSVEIDFGILLEKKVFLKGFYRGGIDAYKKSLKFIEKHRSIRDALETLIDHETEIRGQKSFHDVSDEKHLAEIFDKASHKAGFGRLIIRNLR